MPEPRNIHIITGNDDAQIAARAAEIAAQIAGPDPDAFSFDILEESEAGPDSALVYALIRSVRTPPFFGGAKTVWLKHFSAFDQETAATDLGKALKKLTALIAEGIPKDITLILDGPAKDTKKLPLLKAAAKTADIIELNKPDRARFNWENDMADILADSAREKGLTFRKDALDCLISVLGTDTARIPAELEKIVCFRNENDPAPVTQAEVEAVCTGQGEEFSWSFTNAVGDRNLPECLRIIAVMAADHARPPEASARTLLMAAANHFRQSLRIQSFMSRNRLASPVALKRLIEAAPPDQKAQWKKEGVEFAAYKPFRIQKMAEKALTFSPRETIRALTAVRDALWQCNSSATNPRAALESLLFAVLPKPRS